MEPIHHCRPLCVRRLWWLWIADSKSPPYAGNMPDLICPVRMGSECLSEGKTDMSRLPPMHLINLDRSTERLRLFRERNGHLENVVRVPAIDGSELDREELIISGYISRDLDYGNGSLGCAMSHLKLWEMAASQERSITIFEDDAVTSYQFERVAQETMSKLPGDWDIIQWGCNFTPAFVWVDLGISKARLHCYGPKRYQGEAGLREFQAEEFSPAILKLLHSFGTTGYSISAKGARAALEYCRPLENGLILFPDARVQISNLEIDNVLCGLYPMLQAFISMPQLVLPSGDPSVSYVINSELKSYFDFSDGMINLALDKPASQSSVSQWSNGRAAEEDARGANNDKISAEAGFHTDREQDPWWQVDLEGEYLIRRVVIFNRRHTAHRLRHFSLLRSLDGHEWKRFFRKIDSTVFGDVDDRPYVAEIAGDHPARFVRVRLDGYEWLHFNECQAFGDPLDLSARSQILEEETRAEQQRRAIPAGRNGHLADDGGFTVFVDTERYAPAIISALDNDSYEGRERQLAAGL